MKHSERLSDKIFWHKFTEFYERFLNNDAKCVLEIGVFHGDSIRYWRDKYPNAQIYGLDIIDAQPDWPHDDKITYFQTDQSDVTKYRDILSKTGPVDLLIEDGSHDPLHQKISLIESLPFLNVGSIYILEDLHTSHSEHSYYKTRAKQFANRSFSFSKKGTAVLMPLQCLLLIDHCKANGRTLPAVAEQIDFSKSLFTYEEMAALFDKVKRIHFYKRSVLPDYCYNCRTDDFDFASLKCKCGAYLYEAADSMTALIEC